MSIKTQKNKDLKRHEAPQKTLKKCVASCQQKNYQPKLSSTLVQKSEAVIRLWNRKVKIGEIARKVFIGDEKAKRVTHNAEQYAMLLDRSIAAVEAILIDSGFDIKGN